MRKLAVVLCLILPCLHTMAQGTPALVPIGITNVLTDFQATVGYTLFDKAPTSLGAGWIGYDQYSGIYFTPEVAADGVSQVFMHCPWAAGKGVAYADYLLHFPATTQIKLQFATKEEAISYAKAKGFTYEVVEPHTPQVVPKSYAENFAYGKRK